MSDFSAFLEAAVQTEGILAALLLGRDGLVIEGCADEDIDMDATAALVSRGVDHYEGVSRELKGSSLTWAMFRGGERSFFVRDLTRETLLVLVVEAGPWLDAMDGAMQQWVLMAEKLKQLLSGASDVLHEMGEQAIGEEDGQSARG